jgi:hypothetical protein
MHRGTPSFAILMLIGVGLHGPAAAQTTGVCEAAGAAAEREFALPSGLLQAIGHVETGRGNPADGTVSSFPWSINVEGEDRTAPSAAAAIELVSALQQAGHRSIDVGCFQINLMYHPLAFETLQAAFDPELNANYAARFLTQLHRQTGSWTDAVALYHSASADKGPAYRDRVLRGWLGADFAGRSGDGVVVQDRQPEAARGSLQYSRFGIHVWVPGTIKISVNSADIKRESIAIPKINMPVSVIKYW